MAFKEFVSVFDGSRMLTWSRGLKAHFGIAEMEDVQAAAEPQEILELDTEHACGELAQGQLTTLIAYGLLGRFLAFVAEFGGLENPQRLIDDWIYYQAGEGQPRKGNILVNRLIENGRDYWFKAEEIEA